MDGIKDVGKETAKETGKKDNGEFKQAMAQGAMKLAGQMLAPSNQSGLNIQTAQANAPQEMRAFCDERLKKLEEKGIPVDVFRRIDGYSFEWQGDQKQEEHHGATAQELEENPVTASTVEDTAGVKTVDVKELTMIEAAALGDVARRLEKIESQIQKLALLQGLKFEG